MGHIADVAYLLSLGEAAGDLQDGDLAHAVDDHIHRSICEDGGAQAVLPVVVVGEATQRSLDAAGDDRHTGEKRAQSLAIDDCGVVGAQAGTAVGRIGVVAATAAVGSVVIHHGIHCAGRNAEEEARSAELAEVAQVVLPVGLWHNSHAVAVSLEHAANHRRAHRGVVDISVAREEDYIHIVPAEIIKFFLCGWKPLLILIHRGNM